MSKLIIAIAAFVAVGIPLVAYVWETINRALAGDFDVGRLPLTLLALALLWGVFKLASVTLTRWEGDRK